MDLATLQRFGARALLSGRRAPPAPGEAALLGVALLLGGALAAARVMPAAEEARGVARRTANGLKLGSALLAGSVLADSALEHFRGVYFNRAMYVAPATAAVSLATALHGKSPRWLRQLVFGAVGTTGAAGLGFHAWNILKRPGGLSWSNLFYAAPVAAPGALVLSGLMGYLAGALEGEHGRRGTFGARRLAAPLALAVSGGIVATVGEVALLHFRGAFQNPAMYAPVTVPPLAAAALAAAAADPSRRNLRRARLLLGLTAVLGAVGTGFHAFGVGRQMGGWRNWRQNLFSGPPLPAPPSFTGLGLAGLGVLKLFRTRG